METQKLPFEITQQIRRYLKEMLDFNDEFLAEELGENYILQTYTSKEKPSYKSELNNDKFWSYLGQNGTIKIIGKPKVMIIRHDNRDKNLLVPALYKFKILNIKAIEELFSSFKNQELETHIEGENNHVVPSIQAIQDSKVKFKPLTGFIRYGDETFRFHRGEKGDKPRLSLFKELWGLKKHIKNGKIKAEGRPFPPETLATRINIISEPGVFQRNKQKQNQFYALIKGINREFRRKSIPMRIERNNGVQLVITEK